MSCKRCGACCFPYTIAMTADEDARRWFTYHGLIVRDLDDNTMGIFGHVKCEMLLMNEDGTTSCGVYANRPKICQQFMCKDAQDETEKEG